MGGLGEGERREGEKGGRSGRRKKSWKKVGRQNGKISEIDNVVGRVKERGRSGKRKKSLKKVGRGKGGRRCSGMENIWKGEKGGRREKMSV